MPPCRKLDDSLTVRLQHIFQLTDSIIEQAL